MNIKHPADRGSSGRGTFDRIAEAGSNLSTSSGFFALCLMIVALWLATYSFGASKTLQHLSAEVMAAVTLGLVALLKNAERRSELAVQKKLDLIAAALLERDHGDQTSARDRLREAIGLHDEI